MNAVTKLAIGIALFMIPAAAQAISPHGRLVVGRVQHIDRQNQRAELLPNDESKPLIFAWSNRTTFLRGSDIGGPDDMREGMALQVTRLLPFFGVPQATKIIIPVPADKPRPKDSSAKRGSATRYDR